MTLHGIYVVALQTLHPFQQMKQWLFRNIGTPVVGQSVAQLLCSIIT